MTQVTHYNEFGTKSSRIVASYKSDSENALREAVYTAAQWNKNEAREDMRVNFILCDGKLTTV